MSRERIELGSAGEDLAIKHLIKNGYKILERNFRSRLGEIDIVAKDKGTICFVEVRTRSDLEKGYPQESVTKAKQRQISRVALSYLKSKNLLNRRARFDVVSILKEDLPKIDLIKDAFYLDDKYKY